MSFYYIYYRCHSAFLHFIPSCDTAFICSCYSSWTNCLFINKFKLFFFFLGVDFWQNFLFYFIFFVQALWFIHRKCFRELKYCHNLMFHYIFTTQVPQWYILLKTNEENPHMTHPRSKRMKYYHWVLCSAKSWMCRQKKYTNILEIKFIN